MDPIAASRDWFDRAAEGLLEAARAVRPGDLQRPALGVWNVRDLLGHASRSFVTVETYLATSPSPEVLWLTTPAEYYHAALRSAVAANADEVAERGRAAGAALGEDPVAGLATLAERVRAIVAATPDQASIATPFGTMTLGTYLPTRAFELTVHGLDVCRALGIKPSAELLGTAPDALSLCATLVTPDQAVVALLALTGRHGLPEGFSLM